LFQFLEQLLEFGFFVFFCHRGLDFMRNPWDQAPW